MRVTDRRRSKGCTRQGCGSSLSRLLRIGIALSLILSVFCVQSALASADRAGTPGLSVRADAIGQATNDFSDDASGTAAAEHLAGHLTCVVDAASAGIAAIDATFRRQPIRADFLPRSTAPPELSDPPRS
jgi:hypothetical protein